MEVRDSLQNKIKLNSSLKEVNKLNANSSKNSGTLYSDVTFGIALKLQSAIDKNLNDRQKSRILNELIQNRGFYTVSKSAEKGAVTKIYGEKRKDDSVYHDNLNGAIALNKNGYDVYMLPNLTGMKSPDYILVKDGKTYLAELKTIYGKKSIDNRLNTANKQADRVVLNIVGNISSRYAADEIKDFYLQNPHIKEIIVLKSGTPIYVKQEHVKRKNFTQTFMTLWAK